MTGINIENFFFKIQLLLTANLSSFGYQNKNCSIISSLFVSLILLLTFFCIKPVHASRQVTSQDFNSIS